MGERIRSLGLDAADEAVVVEGLGLIHARVMEKARDKARAQERG